MFPPPPLVAFLEPSLVESIPFQKTTQAVRNRNHLFFARERSPFPTHTHSSGTFLVLLLVLVVCLLAPFLYCSSCSTGPPLSSARPPRSPDPGYAITRCLPFCLSPLHLYLHLHLFLFPFLSLSTSLCLAPRHARCAHTGCSLTPLPDTPPRQRTAREVHRKAAWSAAEGLVRH